MTFHLIHTQSMPIGEQLALEEALLRHDGRNWCLINEGTSPTIVMGISGKAEELVDLPQAEILQIPVLKRFSGGGTVIVDEGTLFVTFICNKELHPFPAYPEPIMRWTEGLYKPLFTNDFQLIDNDYAIGELKCGGNAQYIKKDRWLHHTSFLWDYRPERMACLLHPKKTPKYRSGRGHEAFLTTLQGQFIDKTAFLEPLKKELERRYKVIEVELESVREAYSVVSSEAKLSALL